MSILVSCVAGECWQCFFFFQAEDGIRDYKVTGVQTCALPISGEGLRLPRRPAHEGNAGEGERGDGERDAARADWSLAVLRCPLSVVRVRVRVQIGRASCRERV